MSSDATLDGPPRRRWLVHALWLSGVAVLLMGVAVLSIADIDPTGRVIRDVKGFGGRINSDYDGHEWLRHHIDENRLTMFQRIDRIILDRTAVSDDWLRLLNGRRDLEFVTLEGTSVGDIGIANLGHLPNLRFLNLNSSKVSDEALKSLKNFPNLEELWIIETRITNEGLVHLRDMRQLKQLDLRSKAVTDAGLEHLKHLPALEWLFIGDSQVTAAGIADLKAARPGLTVDLDTDTE